MNSLNFLALDKPTNQLDAGLQESQATQESELLRDGVIQRFKYTYDLSWKMLKRYLEATLPNPEEVGTTSHVYDGEKAREVFSIVPAFLLEAQYLLGRLSEKMDQS